MSGLRSQAASLPPRVSALERSTNAYAAGNASMGEVLFAEAFLVVMPLVRSIVRRHLDGVEDREDAIQSAMTSIWRSVERGELPSIEIRARAAAVDSRRRQWVQQGSGRGRDERPIRERVHVDTMPDIGDDGEADAIVARLDSDMYTPTIIELLDDVRPLWGEIAACLSLGLSQAETALELNRPAGTVRRNVVSMRQHLETVAPRDAA